MNKQKFTEFVQTNILSLFTGSEIVSEEPSSPRDACVAQGTGGSVLVKYKKNDDYRLVIKRTIPFKKFEISIIKTIISEVGKFNSTKLTPEYLQTIERTITERAICISLTPHYRTLLSLLQSINSWGQRTYEGRNTTFGFVLTNKNSPDHNPNLKIDNFLSRDFSALLSNGMDTFLELSADGFVQGYIRPPKRIDEQLFVPHQYLRIANICTGARIGVCLMPSGDILVLKDRAMLFAKRSGKWVSFSHEVIIDRLAERSGENDEVRRAVYLSAIDTGFKHCGGCIVHVDSAQLAAVLKHVNIDDVLTEDCYNIIAENNKTRSFWADLTEDNSSQSFENYLTQEKAIKAASLIKIIAGRKFNELDRRLRVELISIDGATIIDHDGRIIAVGAIIKIEAGSTGGGRLAAAKTLSNYGMAIKISEDGSIQGFRLDRGKLRVVPLFTIG